MTAQDNSAPKTDPNAARLVEQMKSSGSLPALSDNVKDICAVSNMNSSSVMDLAMIVMRDCGLASNILTTANSIVYSPKTPIRTITHAVSYLGFEKIKSLALGLSIFKQTLKSAKYQTLTTLYGSSYFTGAFAMEISRQAGVKNPEEMFVAGLLYRLPCLALANTFPEKYKEVELLTMRNGAQFFNKAVAQVFNIEYDEISRAVAASYNLPDRISEALAAPSNTANPIVGIIHEAGAVSNMLFNDRQGGKEAIENVSKRIGSLLKKSDFKITDFIKDVCVSDSNMKKFFKLEKDDVDMMITTLEWGKGTPAGVISHLNPAEAEAELKPAENPETLFGHYLTELMLESKEKGNLNRLLMLAQEAIYNCLRDSEVFTVFFNKAKTAMVGRLYTGHNQVVKATDFHLPSNLRSSINDCVGKHAVGAWPKEENEPLNLPSLTKYMKPQSAIFTPITSGPKPLGIYFVARCGDEPFNDVEKLWFEQIVDFVNKRFDFLNMEYQV